MSKRLRTQVSILLLAVTMVFSQGVVASFAATSYNVPVLTSVSVANSTIEKGNRQTFNLTFEEETTGVDYVCIEFRNTKNGSMMGWQSFPHYTNPLYSGSYSFNILIEDKLDPGEYYVSDVYLKNQSQNVSDYAAKKTASGDYYFEYNNEMTTMKAPTFTVTGEAGDSTGPILKSIKINNKNNTVSSGENIEFQMEIEEETGIDELNFVLRKPSINNEQRITFLAEDLQKIDENTYIAKWKITDDLMSGEWYIQHIWAFDTAGNYSVTSDELGGFMNEKYNMDLVRFTIVSDMSEDVVPPQLVSAEILNENNTINKPGILKFKLDFKDLESGVSYIDVILVDKDSTDDNGVTANIVSSQIDDPRQILLKEPIKDGSVILDIPFDADHRTGEWYVQRITFSDKAGNINYVSSMYDEATIKFNVEDEFQYDLITALSNPNLNTQLSNTKAGDVANILIDSDGIFTKENWEAIKGKDVTLVFYKDAYQWIVNGKDIKNETKDVDLDLTFKQVAGSEINSDVDAIGLTFEPNGELPAQSKIRFKSDYMYSYLGKEENFHLYYVVDGNYTENETVVDLSFDGSDEWCSFTIDHNSYFILSPKSIKTPTMKNATVKGYSASYTYSGKAINPSVSIYLSGQKLKQNTDYRVTYGSNKNVGNGTITITGIGGYKSTGVKSVSFNINPKGTSAKAPKKAKKALTAKWKANKSRMSKSRITGYQIQIATNTAFTANKKSATVKGYKKTSKKFSKLKAKTKYYVRVRTYMKSGGKTYYSNWSSPKNVKTK